MIRLLIWVLSGAFSGSVAGKLMNSEYTFLGNLLLGIIGGIVGAIVIGIVGLKSTNIIGQIIVSIIGGCIVVWAARNLKK